MFFSIKHYIFSNRIYIIYYFNHKNKEIMLSALSKLNNSTKKTAPVIQNAVRGMKTQSMYSPLVNTL